MPTSIATRASSRSMRSPKQINKQTEKQLCCGLLNKLTEINVCDYHDSPNVRSKVFGDLKHKTFDNLWKSKENDGAVQWLLTSLDKLIKNKKELHDKN